MRFETLDFEILEAGPDAPAGSVGLITFNRPERLNALVPRMALELDALFDRIAHDGALRVVILTGRGKGFSVGGDLKEEAGVVGVSDIDSGLRGPYRELGEYFLNDLFHKTMQSYSRKFEHLPQITIAAVNGWAVGAGLELMAMADIRIAGASAKFSEQAVKQGFITEIGGTRVLPKLIGKGKAMEMILTGRVVDAEEAERIGLVDRLTSDEELLTSAVELAETIARQPYVAVRQAKELVLQYWTADESEKGWAAELASVLEIIRTPDNHEGIRSFLEKRDPVYRGPRYDGPSAQA